MKNIPPELVPLALEVRSINRTLKHRKDCYYCGEMSQCEDHVIPHAFAVGSWLPRKGWEVDTLPACNECNQFLSSAVFNSLDNRRSYLRKKVSRRYIKYIGKTPWTVADMDNLSPMLRDGAEIFNRMVQTVARRLRRLSGELLPEAHAETPTKASDPFDGVEIRVLRKRAKAGQPWVPMLNQWFRHASGLIEYGNDKRPYPISAATAD